MQKCLFYISCQLFGGIAGALLDAGLFYQGNFIGEFIRNKYGVDSASGQRESGVLQAGVLDGGSGCPVPYQANSPDRANFGQIFGAEYFGTMLLVLTVYQTAIAQ